MSDKQTILEAIDRRQVLLPSRVSDALQANARIKYYLSLLQLASAHADDPDAPALDLAAERERCGLDDADLDAVVSRARLVEDHAYRIPRLRDVLGRIDGELQRMISPLALADGAAAAEPWVRRLESLRERPPEGVGSDTIDADALAWMTSAAPDRDSPHRLCMDLHKAVDDVQARLASETIAGARCFGIREEDRPLVAAFMRGVERTAKLKFDHPGLGTTATHSGPRLVIENDIGTTDAHVLVVEVEGAKVVITSADIHVQRLDFFQRMLAAFPVDWQDTRSRRAPGLEQDSFFLCVGTLEARSDAELWGFLEHLGSRLVFLIDWNKARKTLQAFVPKNTALGLLDWAAGANLGHRGLLELGGDRLVYDAMAAVMRTPLRFGERLEDAIGVGAATGFMRFALRETTEGLLEGRSHSLIRERVRAELASAHVLAGDRLLEPVARHAAVIEALASAVSGEVSLLGAGDGDASARPQAASRAKKQEHDADEIVVEMRSLAERMPDAGAFGPILEAADDAADDLEEAVFVATLMPSGAALSDGTRGALQSLGELVVQDCAAWIACVESARHARRGVTGPEMRAFLAAVDHIVTLEREADDAERRATAELMLAGGIDARILFVTARIAEHLEDATDALMHAALELRDRVQGAVMIDRP